MTGLVYVGDDLIPLDHIERATPYWDLSGKAGQGKIKLRGKDASSNVWNGVMDGVLMRPTQLLPAEAGTHVLRVWIEAGSAEAEVFKTPVIAWALCFDGEIRPVTPHGVNDGSSTSRPIYVEMPEGSVYSTSPHDETPRYDDVESYRLGEGAREVRERDAQAQRGAAA